MVGQILDIGFVIRKARCLNSEMVFEEDIERVENFDLIINFLESQSLNNYFDKKLDMAT